MQKYKILKAIHNVFCVVNIFLKFFKHAKIQNFESDSQLRELANAENVGFLSMQKYKILKAIHNMVSLNVSRLWFFKHAKIQNFESDSQHNGASGQEENVF